MNGYEKIINLMQKQGNNQSSSFYITTMDSINSCKVNGLQLDSDDLLIAEHLKTGYLTQEGDAMHFIEPLKENDTVVIVKINEEQYAIIERLVSV